jgi:hypothetical protein
MGAIFFGLERLALGAFLQTNHQPAAKFSWPKYAVQQKRTLRSISSKLVTVFHSKDTIKLTHIIDTIDHRQPPMA